MALDETVDGKFAVVDGTNGVLYVEPDEETLETMRRRQREEQEKKELLQTLKGRETVTMDGKKIRLYANIGNSKDLASVIQNDAAGIGLFRSEFLYLEKETFPTEEEQFQVYKQVAETMAGKPVIIRTLDIGADKQIGYFDLPKEDNPAMGMRALRICLTRPEIFKTQLRALFRASAFGKLGIMSRWSPPSGRSVRPNACARRSAARLEKRRHPLQRGCADRHYDRDAGRRHDERRAGT